MKKFFVVLMLACCAGSAALHAQEMRKGMNLGNVGVGFVDGIGLNASYDYGLVDTWGPGVFTVGGFVGFDTWSYNRDIRRTEFYFAPRATYRYAINRSFEVYGAAMLGSYIVSYSEQKDNSYRAVLFVTGGCRYSFTRNLSVFAELGFNVSILNGGLSFSF